MSNTRRINALDIAKGIAIIMVLLGHIDLTPKLIKLWIYSFHMPLFFICSGLSFSIERYPNFSSFLLSKIKSMILPYFILGFSLFYLRNMAFSIEAQLQGKALSPLKWNPLTVLQRLSLANRGHSQYLFLWFICVLFISELALYCVIKKAQERKYAYLLLFIVATFLQSFVFRYLHGFYWSLDLVPSGIAFLSLGYFIKLQKPLPLFTVKNRFHIVAPLLINLIFMTLNYRVTGTRVDLFNCKIGNPLFYAMAAVSGSLFVLLLSFYYSSMPILGFFGKNSLVIYVYNKSFSIRIATALVTHLAQRHPSLFDITAQWIAIIFFSLVISYVLVYLINRFFPWSLGKTPSKKSLMF